MPYTSRHLLKRAKTKSAVGIAAAAALGVAPLIALSALPAAAADEGCPADYRNPWSGAIEGTDSNPNVFAGKDMKINDVGSELEGMLVVGGDLSFDRTSSYTMNTVIGSGVVAPAGTNQIVVGGDITGADRINLSAGIVGGGNVVYGGTIDGMPKVNGGSVEADASAYDRFADWPEKFSDVSSYYGSLDANGTVEISSSELKLTGDGVSDRQVFTVDGDKLGNPKRGLTLANIDPQETVIINVTGSDDLTLDIGGFAPEGAVSPFNPLDPTDNVFASYTQHVLWNIVDSDSVTFTGGDQFLGSVLVPSSQGTTTIDSHMNGRVYVAGNLLQGGDQGTGLEFHSYPFVDGDVPVFGCSPEPKIVVPDDPTDDPTSDPSDDPTDDPSEEPTENPTEDPGDNESEDPGNEDETGGDDESNDPGDNESNDPGDNKSDNVDGDDSTETPGGDTTESGETTTNTDNGSVVIDGTDTGDESTTGDDSDKLADTGSSLAWLPLGATALVLMGGAGLLAANRRTRRS